MYYYKVTFTINELVYSIIDLRSKAKSLSLQPPVRTMRYHELHTNNLILTFHG